MLIKQKVSLVRQTKIIPTIFSKNKKEFEQKLTKLIPISKKLQIDLMDGKFVNNESVKPQYIPDLNKYNNDFEAHLMVQKPRLYYEKIKNKGFKKIIMHIDAFENETDAINFFKEIKKQKQQPVIAINPDTKLTKKIIESFNFFLIMGVKPGKEKQKLIPTTYNKIKKIKQINPRAKIQVDGGVTPINSSKLFKAGANYLNSGSFISNNDEPKKALFKLIKEV